MRSVARISVVLVVIAVVCALAVVGWVAWQDAGYRAERDAYTQRVGAALSDMPTGLEEKNAIVASGASSVAKQMRIDLVIARSPFLESAEAELASAQRMTPNARWKAFHASFVEMLRERVAVERGVVAFLEYVDDYLGDRPSDRRIVALVYEEQYAKLRNEIELHRSEYNRSRDLALKHRPRLSRWVLGSPDEVGRADPTGNSGRLAMFDAQVSCATARLAHVDLRDSCERKI